MDEIFVGVDTGGTFTDIVVSRGSEIRVHKVLSTPDDPARAIMQGLREVGVLEGMSVLVHGSTVATNAVLERRGARTGLITTQGFRDVLEIGRQTREKLYDLRVGKVPPLVPRALRMEVRERLNERGAVMVGLDEDSVRTAIEGLKREGIEAVAVCLLFSFANDEHERRVAEMARAEGWYVSASAEVVPEFREYERTSTVVLNAYVGPLMEHYLGRLEQALPKEVVLRIMQSNGGSISSEMARQVAARTLLSGPAAGVVGAAFVGEAVGLRRVITLDIGGTSTDVAAIDGVISEATEGRIGGYPTKLPMIDIHTVGAGGGSIAWFDVGGALRVGPRSAGAQPGPAAYGRGGTEATVTDANVVLGRLIASAFLGGGMGLDVEGARRAVGRIAERLGTSVEEAALGIVRIVNANMEGAMRVISVERGNDPRDFVLTVFGGAGPLHACELAEALRIPRVLVPRTPGVLSALGMLAADVVKDYVRTVMVSTREAGQVVSEVVAELEARGREELAREGVADVVIERVLDMRYVGQSYELGVTFAGEIEWTVEGFHDVHEKRFGYSDRDEHVEVVNVRVKAKGVVTKPVLERQDEAQDMEVGASETRAVVFGGKDGVVTYETGVHEREKLVVGARVQGPAIVTQYDTTTVIAPDWWARVDAMGNIVMERKEEKR